LGHLSDLSDMYDTSVTHVSNTVTRLI